MSNRIDMGQTQPDAIKAIMHLEQYMAGTELPKLHKELIKIRASQINGCAYCVNMHTADARKYGETEQRINLICVWREAHGFFTEEEQLLLAMTEEMTLLHQHGLSDELYEKSIRLFGEVKTAQIVMAVITINAWNRMAVSLHTKIKQE